VVAELKATGLIQPYEKEYFRKDGSRVPVLVAGVLFEEEGGEGVAFALDLSEQKRAEEALRCSEAYLLEAQRLTHTGSWAWNPDTDVRYWSEECYRVLGFDRRDGLPRIEELIQRIHHDDQPAFRESAKRSRHNKLDEEVEYRVVHPGGAVRNIHSIGHPVFSPHGDLIEYTGTVMDITERKRAEEELRRSERELRDVIDTIPSMLWSASPSGELTHLSQRFLEYCGTPLEELVNRGWERVIHPDDLGETTKAFALAISSGGSYRAIHRMRRADGEYRWHQSMSEPMRDPDGKIIRRYGLAIDIDERKRAEDHLRDTRVKLAKASRFATVAELAGSIAHELNQPLMSILANAQAAKRWLNAAPSNVMEANLSIERIIRDARAADETMKHIRALFKQESFDKRDVNIPNILREVVRVVQEDPKKRDVPIKCHFEECLPVVHVDQIQIQQVFINLIVNAIEALEGRQETPLVVLRAVTESDGMLIQVIDNGPGVVDPDQIFDAFMTTKEKGMGIGLAVSRSIVAAHGGRLWAENNKTRGATFNVALPLSQASLTTA
jgi:PAS domain S-box-containing protein